MAKEQGNSIKNIKVNSLKAWLFGIRPSSLGGALITVLVGSGLAHGTDPMGFSWWVASLCALFACLMQVAANLINDLVDFERGLDEPDPSRIDRIYANGLITEKAMKWGIGVVSIVGIIVGMAIYFIVGENLMYGGAELFIVGAVVVTCTFVYSMIMAYHAVGDIAVLICFGILPVCTTYYVLTYRVDIDALLASLIVGCSIDTLMILNNVRDVNEDREKSKVTSVVVLGHKIGKGMYLIAGYICIAMLMLLWYNDRITTEGLCYTAFPYLILHSKTSFQLMAAQQPSEMDKLYYATPRNFTILGILLTIALW